MKRRHVAAYILQKYKAITWRGLSNDGNSKHVHVYVATNRKTLTSLFNHIKTMIIVNIFPIDL